MFVVCVITVWLTNRKWFPVKWLFKGDSFEIEHRCYSKACWARNLSCSQPLDMHMSIVCWFSQHVLVGIETLGVFQIPYTKSILMPLSICREWQHCTFRVSTCPDFGVLYIKPKDFGIIFVPHISEAIAEMGPWKLLLLVWPADLHPWDASIRLSIGCFRIYKRLYNSLHDQCTTLPIHSRDHFLVLEQKLLYKEIEVQGASRPSF